MSRPAAVTDSARSEAPATAALLVNTGTPAAPRSAEVRAFLRRFLSDRRVVELPRALWLPLLRGVILPRRGPRSAHKYARIWLPEGSPLFVYNSRLTAALARELSTGEAPIQVRQAFLYSEPNVPDTIQSLLAAGVQRLIVLPLYPQCSGSTTGAVYDQVGAALSRNRSPPELHLVHGYSENTDYIGALAASVTERWQQQGRRSHLLISFHGVPVSFITGGDRYEAECRATAARLAAALHLSESDWSLSFQSRFGANRWLTPATDQTLHELPARGIKDLTLVCPGFAVDCLETLEEIALEGRDTFLSAGGEHFDYVPALNDGAAHVTALARLIRRAGGG